MDDSRGPSENPFAPVEKVLQSAAAVVIFATGYAYFLGWVVLWSELAALSMSHEMRNLPLYEYLSATAEIVSFTAFTVGSALIGRIVLGSRWPLALLPSLLFHANRASQAALIRDELGGLGFFYPRVAFWVIGGTAAFIIICSIKPVATRKWLRSRVSAWKPAPLILAGCLATFLLFHDAMAIGFGRAMVTLLAPHSVELEVSDAEHTERLRGRNLVLLKKIEDRWYFDDRTRYEGARVLNPIMLNDSYIVGINFLPNPDVAPDAYEAIKKEGDRPATGDAAQPDQPK